MTYELVTAETIRWADIVTECGDYRDGFVAVFRKYEGQPTDETTEQGRPVLVTVSSFGRHMGIPESTFKNWVARAAAAPTPSRDRVAEGLRNSSFERQAELILEVVRENPGLGRVVYDALRSEFAKHFERASKEVDLERAAYDAMQGLSLKLGDLSRYQPNEVFSHASEGDVRTWNTTLHSGLPLLSEILESTENRLKGRLEVVNAS